MLNVFRPALALRWDIDAYIIHRIGSIQVKTPTVKTLAASRTRRRGLVLSIGTCMSIRITGNRLLQHPFLSLSDFPRTPLPSIMASDNPSSSRIELYDSTMTVPSDSENYSANHELSYSPPSSSSSPLILYKPPTIWSILRGAAINLVLPFVNGLMLGFGELFAHEAAYRLGWSGTKVRSFRAHAKSRVA